MNPMNLLKIKGMFQTFQKNHPRVPAFFRDASRKVDVGSVIEISLETSGGEKICTNMRVKEEDLQLVQQLTELGLQK